LTDAPSQSCGVQNGEKTEINKTPRATVSVVNKKEKNQSSQTDNDLQKNAENDFVNNIHEAPHETSDKNAETENESEGMYLNCKLLAKHGKGPKVLVSILCDSGATKNFISIQTLHQLGKYTPKITPVPDAQGHGAVFGSELDIIGGVKLLVKIGHTTHLIEFRVVRNLLLSCILGYKWLHRNGYETDFSSLKHLPTGEIFKLQSAENAGRTLISSEEITISPGQVQYINCHTRKRHSVYSTYVAQISDKFLPYSCNSLININKGRHTQLLISNQTNRPLRISKNEVVAQSEPVGGDNLLCFLDENSMTQLQSMQSDSDCFNTFEIEQSEPSPLPRKSPTRTKREIPLTSDPLKFPDKNKTDRELVKESLNLENSVLNEEQKQELLELLVKKSKAFNLRGNIGRSRTYTYDAKIIKEAKNFYQRPYTLSDHEIQLIHLEIEKLQKLKLVTDQIPTSNKGVNFVSAGFLACKQNSRKSSRYIIDLRLCNSFSALDKIPNSNLSDLLMRLGRIKPQSYIQMDLNLAYHQIPITKDSMALFQFNCPPGGQRYPGGKVLAFRVIPFGYKNASTALERCLKNLLGDIPDLLHFADDLLLAITDFRQGMNLLEEVLDRIISDNLTFSLSKCSFFTETAEFVGQSLKHGCAQPLQKHIEAIKKLETPTSKPQLRRLLGTCCYLNAYCKDFSVKTSDLYELLSKSNKNWVWLPKHEEVFQEIKKCMMDLPCLKLPSFKKGDDLILCTDASTSGTGAVLYQKCQNERGGKDLYVLGYASKKFKPSDHRGLSSYELEILGIKHALKAFHQFVYGSKLVQIFCDNKGCVSTIQGKNTIKSVKVRNAMSRILGYGFQVRHLAGKENVVSDFLSRIHKKSVQNNKKHRNGLPAGGVPPELEKHLQSKPDFVNNSSLPELPTNNVNMLRSHKHSPGVTTRSKTKEGTPKPVPQNVNVSKATPDQNKKQGTTQVAKSLGPQNIAPKNAAGNSGNQEQQVRGGVVTPPNKNVQGAAGEDGAELRRSRRQTNLPPEYDHKDLEKIKKQRKQKITENTGVSEIPNYIQNAVAPTEPTSTYDINNREEFPPLVSPSDQNDTDFDRRKMHTLQQIRNSASQRNESGAEVNVRSNDSTDIMNLPLDHNKDTTNNSVEGGDEPEIELSNVDSWLEPYLKSRIEPIFNQKKLTIQGRYHFSVPGRVRDKIKNILNEKFHNQITHQIIKDEQFADPNYKHLITYFRSRKLPLNKGASNNVLRMEPHFLLINDLLFRVGDNTRLEQGVFEHFKLVVPVTLATWFIRSFHRDYCGHQRYLKTYNRLNRDYYIWGLPKLLRKFLKSCSRCQKLKKFQEQQKPLTIASGVNVNSPMKSIQYDYANVPFDHSYYKYFIVAVCEYSNYVFAKLTPKNDAITAAKFLAEIIHYKGYPKFLSSDRGPHFRAQVSEELSKLMNFKHSYSAGYNARATGLCESFVKSIKSLLKQAQIDSHSGDLAKNFADAVMIQNTSINDELGYSSFYLFHGFNYRSKLDTLLDIENVVDPDDLSPFGREIYRRNQLRRSLQVKSKLLKREKQKFTHDINLNKPQELKEGDFCYLRSLKHPLSSTSHRSSKVHKAGPFKIVNLTNHNALLMDHLGRIGRNHYSLRNLEVCDGIPDDSFPPDSFVATITTNKTRTKPGKHVCQKLHYPISKFGVVLTNAGFWA